MRRQDIVGAVLMASVKAALQVVRLGSAIAIAFATTWMTAAKISVKSTAPEKV